MNIGTKIKKLREDRNLSQKDLAYELEISQGALCKLESGNVGKVDFALMHKICDFFEVDFQYFLEDSFSQNNTKNKNSAISIFGNPVVHNHLDEDIAEVFRRNQEHITTLIEAQNKLMEEILRKK